MYIEDFRRNFWIVVGRTGSKETKKKLGDLIDILIENNAVNDDDVFPSDEEISLQFMDYPFTYAIIKSYKGKCVVRINRCPEDAYQKLDEFLFEDKRKWTKIIEIGA